MNRIKNVRCPYCAFENHVQVNVLEAGRHAPQIVACDSDAGGCDRYFVVKPTTEIAISVAAFGVDGLNDGTKPARQDDQLNRQILAGLQSTLRAVRDLDRQGVTIMDRPMTDIVANLVSEAPTFLDILDRYESMEDALLALEFCNALDASPTDTAELESAKNRARGITNSLKALYRDA